MHTKTYPAPALVHVG